MGENFTGLFFMMLIAPCLVICSSVGPVNPAVRLEQYLFTNYSTIARPVRRSTDPINVSFDFILNQVLQVNEQEQKVTTAVWNVRVWKDEFLSWKPEDYGNITDIRISKHRIWYPDLVVTNTIQMEEPDIKIKLDSSGEVMWDSALVLETSCHINVKFFPYDHQFCKILIGSWTFPQKELDLRNSSPAGIIDYYIENDAWELLGVTVHRSLNPYPGYDSPLVDLEYTIHLKRRPRFFELNIILPCALLSVVVIAVFCLPCECGEKITLSITILLALAVNNVMISEKMPPSSKNSPVLGDYFLAQVSLVMFSVFASVLVLTIHHKGTQRKPIPPYIRHLAFEVLAKRIFLESSITSLRMKRKWLQTERAILVTNGSAMHNGSRLLNPVIESRLSSQNAQRIESSIKFPLIGGTGVVNSGRATSSQSQHNSESSCDTIQDDLETVKRSLVQIKNFISQHEQDLETETEWKELAMVVDRIFAIFFFIISSVVSLVFMVLMPLGADWQLQKVLNEHRDWE